MISDASEFRTSNTALAAYLITEGFKYPELDINGRRVFFVFDTTDDKIEKHIRDFGTLQATGNIPMFFNTYQDLLRRVREGY